MKAREFGKRLVKEALDDDVLDVAAMMTYYAIFALFPMLVFGITVALLIVPPDVVQQTVDMATAALPNRIATVIAEQVTRMQEAAGAGFAVGSALLALWGASRGAAALGNALNRVYRKKESRPWWKRQVIAVVVTAGVALLVIASLALLAIGPIAGYPLFRWLGAGVLMMLVWAILYRFLPDTDAPFRIFTPGAAAGVVLWVLVTQGFAFYLDRFADYEATYGTLAGVIIFLFWLWLSNLAVLIGAEINDVLADARKDTSPAAARLAQQET
jgi:membrane protein